MQRGTGLRLVRTSEAFSACFETVSRPDLPPGVRLYRWYLAQQYIARPMLIGTAVNARTVHGPSFLQQKRCEAVCSPHPCPLIPLPIPLFLALKAILPTCRPPTWYCRRAQVRHPRVGAGA